MIMTKNEFESLINKKSKLITVDDLINNNPRTLLSGYTLNRESFEVDLTWDQNIEVTIDNKPVNVNFNENYIPSKRVYPEESDYEFCKLLIDRGVDIPFTNY